jgi:hypothetical protein
MTIGQWLLPCKIGLSANQDSRYAVWLVNVPQA